LISNLEEWGIWTDASIPSHIKSIIDNGFVKVDAEWSLVPTALGIAYIRGICEVDPELASLNMILQFEKSFESIVEEKVNYL